MYWRWLSDSVEYQELARFGRCLFGLANSKDAAIRKTYASKREAVEEAFKRRLEDCESGQRPRVEGARSIDPSLFALLEVDYALDEVQGMGRCFEKPEFFEITSIPLNVRFIPDWVDAQLGALGLNVFRHDRDYRHIVLHGIDYTLSRLHAKIVELLHKAWLQDDAWQKGRDVLEEAGSTQLKMGDAFKSRNDWRSFIDSDRKGMYRLRMDHPAEQED